MAKIPAGQLAGIFLSFLPPFEKGGWGDSALAPTNLSHFQRTKMEEALISGFFRFYVSKAPPLSKYKNSGVSTIKFFLFLHHQGIPTFKKRK
jgi:hypothetical protein